MIRHKLELFLIILLICVIGAIVAKRYHKFIQEDPAFCTLCHRTQEGFDSWEKSSHYMLTCQQCHTLDMLEGNKLLMGYYVKGDHTIKQNHGRIKPWENCAECHERDVNQGSLTFRESYGHAKHIFMHNTGCNQCHQGKMHQLNIVESEKCRVCHTDKLVHGMGTTGLYCLNCHSFRDSHKKMVSSERCYTCHSSLNQSPVMATLECYDCHHPHVRDEKIQSQDCLGSCHSSETRVGQHQLHLDRTELSCVDCHRPHVWRITQRGAKGLCDRCHALKDPGSFIF